VETLPLAKSEDSKKRLLDIIQHDVRRLDRLISDISDASRLDAELARSDSKKVDLERLLESLVDISSQVRSKGKKVPITLAVDRKNLGKGGFVVIGYESRLGQIITNLIENARSFVPNEGGTIDVRLRKEQGNCVVEIEDNGPGIEAENIDRIFERFYTDRPNSEDFGQNSGLGLSISRQIAEAHGGTLEAENVTDKSGKRLGARFILTLPEKGQG
jgi:two-component system sensor histidine kinase ChvG